MFINAKKNAEITKRFLMFAKSFRVLLEANTTSYKIRKFICLKVKINLKIIFIKSKKKQKTKIIFLKNFKIDLSFA